MIGIYYRIWIDCLKRARLQPASKHNWYVGSMIFMTMAMAFNLVVIMTILEKYVFHFYFYKINVPFFPVYVNNVFSYIFLFIFPCAAINYLLIFRNKKYKKLLKRYPYYDGKLFVTYFLLSMMSPILLLWIGIFFFK